VITVNDFWDILTGILTLALVATVLTKANTATDIKAAGGTFSGAISAAEAG
jgi:hypothetical protein